MDTLEYNSGTRQGDLISSLLTNVILEWVIRTVVAIEEDNSKIDRNTAPIYKIKLLGKQLPGRARQHHNKLNEHPHLENM